MSKIFYRNYQMMKRLYWKMNGKNQIKNGKLLKIKKFKINNNCLISLKRRNYYFNKSNRMKIV